jgi:hypothetical protein
VSPRDSFVARWLDLPRLEQESVRFEMCGPARLTTGFYVVIPVSNEKEGRELIKRVTSSIGAPRE